MATPPPYTVRLDADAARAATATGGTLLLLDVPAGTVVGVDHQSFVTGPMFCGVKMIPPGVHFVTYAATGGGSGGESAGGALSSTAAPPRPPPTSSGVATWFWLDVAPASVTVRRWCAGTELLLPLEDEDEEGRFAAGVRRFDFDTGLAPYNLGGGTTWDALTAHVTPATARRIMGRHPNCSVAAEADPAAGRAPTAAEIALDAALAAGRRGQEAPSSSSATTSIPGVGAPTFTHFPRLASAPRDAPPSAASAANVDKSGLLASILTSTYRTNSNALLGELEAAFVCAWAGHSLSALAAWGDGVRLLLGCTDAAVGEHAALFGDALTMLRVQLSVSVGGGGGSGGHTPLSPPSTLIDGDALLEDAFLKRSLRGFYEGLAEAGGGPPEVQRAADALRRSLGDRLGWRVDVASLGGGGASDGDNSDCPVVVVDAERGW